MLKRHTKDRPEVEIPDLQTQYEALLDTVWRCEERARFEDRIDAWNRYEELQSRRCPARD